ncbi:MAG: dihydropteroate synthase [Oscillospiraceae bacterium]|nr:dihydropteroate synthase [Oscillospiraceae bacterium]
MQIGGREFDTVSGCYVMGILNVTPDSFSDGGKWDKLDSALKHVQDMIGEGADIIDIGGESSRPGHESISVQEELNRALPVVEAVRSRFDVPISIDTCKSEVAKAALSAGADLVNDIWGLKSDPGMAGVIAQAGAACCLMHNRADMDYSDFIPDVLDDLRESLILAKKAGIADDKVILDPGVGFAKTHEMNLGVINRLDAIKAMGYPVLLGASRKRVVGNTLDLPVEERVEGSLAAAIIGLVRGCCFVRVHDVKETCRAIKMAQAILGA